MYKCTECARSFDYEKNLERHMAKHKEGTLKEGDDQQVISRDSPILVTKLVNSYYFYFNYRQLNYFFQSMNRKKNSFATSVEKSMETTNLGSITSRVTALSTNAKL